MPASAVAAAATDLFASAPIRGRLTVSLPNCMHVRLAKSPDFGHNP